MIAGQNDKSQEETTTPQLGCGGMKKLSSLFLLLIVIAISGCATVPVDETQSISKPEIEKTKEDLNAATIIFLQEERTFEYSFSVDLIAQPFASCIKNKILKHNPNQKFIPFSQVTSNLFPDLPKERVPSSPEDFSILLDDEKFYTDISAMGIRYLIFVGEGHTTETGEYSRGGCIGMAFPPGGIGGCLYWHIWVKESQLSATILDVHLKNDMGKNVDNVSTGKAWFAIVGVVPMGMPSFTEHKACSNVGNDIGKILLEKATR